MGENSLSCHYNQSWVVVRTCLTGLNYQNGLYGFTYHETVIKVVKAFETDHINSVPIDQIYTYLLSISDRFAIAIDQI